MGRRGATLLVAAVLAAGMATPVASANASDLPGAAAGLGLSCVDRQSTDDTPVRYIHCTGDIATFDGMMLDVGLTLPRSPGSDPLPTIIDLEGWPGGRAESSATSSLPFWPRDWHWNNVWWSTKGYATLALSPRGLGGSCNQEEMTPDCAGGYSHLADKHFEVRDVQHLLGVLVDAGIADPSRLAATGESYGGGQTWNLATSLPWMSPRGRELQLAAAVPIIGWTDLEGSLVPNGRRSDDADRPAGGGPIGVMQQSMISGFWALGRAQASARYGSDPRDLGAHFDGAYAVWSAGEPYGPAAHAVRNAWRSKSALFNDDYLAAIAAREVGPVPTLAISGWTDPVFPAPESLQMYRRLKAADPEYPISLFFADIGHQFPANTQDHWQAVLTEANTFLDSHLAGVAYEHHATSLPASCTSPLSSSTRDASWDLLRGRKVEMNGGAAVITHDPRRHAATLNDDPIIEPTLLSPAPCVETSETPSTLSWAWSLGDETTLLGLPTVRFDYDLAGADATVIAKLWDKAPTGGRTLVTRGVYRLSAASGDPLQGSVAFDLFGNHWEVAAGHELVLELSATDAPFLRPGNLPFVLSLENVVLEVPVIGRS